MLERRMFKDQVYIIDKDIDDISTNDNIELIDLRGKEEDFNSYRAETLANRIFLLSDNSNNISYLTMIGCFHGKITYNKADLKYRVSYMSKSKSFEFPQELIWFYNSNYNNQLFLTQKEKKSHIFLVAKGLDISFESDLDGWNVLDFTKEKYDFSKKENRYQMFKYDGIIFPREFEGYEYEHIILIRLDHNSFDYLSINEVFFNCILKKDCIENQEYNMNFCDNYIPNENEYKITKNFIGIMQRNDDVMIRKSASKFAYNLSNRNKQL